MGACSDCAHGDASTVVEATFVGVRFDDEATLILCSIQGSLVARGDEVVVERQKGPAMGRVEKSPMPVFKRCQKAKALRILRAVTHEDAAAYQHKVQRDQAAERFCRERARALGLEMKVSRVDSALFQKRASVYFTAEARVDFRQLVRDLSRRFSARFKMVQVGARDESKLIGGIGVCGRTLCCSTWLEEFRPISIQMAKRQNLSLNPSKISGQCGRLLCCLAYEEEQYRKPQQPQPGR